ncbi:MAG: recombination protein RecR [Saprospiraceae bacterium]|nr:recombination mediator RecR [Candidatus Brachybacter algidus]MBK8749587.1 recombination protein RecR [Candidatus Brachybacter algidus]
MKYSSQLIEKAVDSFSSLPGIGRKTALRLALHLLNKDEQWVEGFSNSFVKLKRDLKECNECHNLGDEATCSICSDKRRNSEVLCIVESIRDLMAIEETGHFHGLFHVLGGLISPIDGIGPDHLNIEDIVMRVEKNGIKEIVLAISPNIEGETTMFYISKKLKQLPVKISTISRGISFGGELEYADEVTLGRSIISRVPYFQYDEVAAAR